MTPWFSIIRFVQENLSVHMKCSMFAIFCRMRILLVVIKDKKRSRISTPDSKSNPVWLPCWLLSLWYYDIDSFLPYFKFPHVLPHLVWLLCLVHFKGKYSAWDFDLKTLKPSFHFWMFSIPDSRWPDICRMDSNCLVEQMVSCRPFTPGSISGHPATTLLSFQVSSCLFLHLNLLYRIPHMSKSAAD